MIYSSWGVERDGLKMVILDHFLPFYSPKNPKNQNFEKKKKIAGDIIILFMCMYHEVWFLRYGVRQTEFFVILGYFLPFYPPNDPENQNFEKMKCCWCAVSLSIMDLCMSSLGTLVPEGPWCVFYATRCQVYWGLAHNVVLLLILWFDITHTNTHTYTKTQYTFFLLNNNYTFEIQNMDTKIKTWNTKKDKAKSYSSLPSIVIKKARLKTTK